MINKELKEIGTKLEIIEELVQNNDYLKKVEKATITINNRNIELQQRIDRAIEYIKHSQNYGTMAQVMPHLKPYVNGDDLLEILGDKE